MLATALSTANTALTNANSAVTTANTASSNAATAAVSTANTASTNASNAVTTANSAVTTANGAVTTANTADTNSNTAITTANAAAAAVANAVLYTTVANVAAIPASPANNAAVEVTNSTGIESFTPLSGLPAGFIGSSGLSVRIIYQTVGATWTWIQYFPNDPEARYLKLAGGTLTGIGAASPSAKLEIAHGNELGIYTNGPYNFQAKFESSDSEAAIVIEDSNSTNDGNRIGVIGDNMAFTTANSERLRIDASGKLLVGTSTARSNVDASTGLLAPQVQIEGTDAGASSLSIIRNSASSPPRLYLARTKSGSVGGNVAVISDDILGEFLFNGADGTNLIEAASISCGVDGTPGANDMPGRLVLSTTADGASSPTERLRITSAGNVGIGTTNPIAKFVVSNSGAEGVEILPADSANLSIFQAYNRSSSVYNTLQFRASDHQFYIAGSEKVRIDSSGRLGIGTSSPVERLHLSGVSSWVRLDATAAGGGNFMLGSSEIGGSRAFSIYDLTGSAYRLSINSSGNVGIGTAAPWSQLSSYGESGATAQYLGFKSADGGDIRFGKASGVDNTCILGTWTGNRIKFYTNGTNVLDIDTSGRLVVGTSTSSTTTTSANTSIDVRTISTTAYSASNLSAYTGAYISNTPRLAVKGNADLSGGQAVIPSTYCGAVISSTSGSANNGAGLWY
jgi:hypothetical protein